MLIEQINSLEKRYEFIGYFDDGYDKGVLMITRELTKELTRESGRELGLL